MTETYFSDVNQWHRVTNRKAYEDAGRQLIEIRCMSGSSGKMVTDTEFVNHRSRFRGFPRLYYFFPYNQASPEQQADWFANSLVQLDPATEMIMLDIEAGSKIKDPEHFTRVFLARIEYRFREQKCWVYLPKSLASKEMYEVIGDRLIKAPRFSGNANRGAAPNWGHWDVHQYTDKGWMPGSPDGPGDCNYTPLSVHELLMRSRKNTQDKKSKGGLILLGD